MPSPTSSTASPGAVYGVIHNVTAIDLVIVHGAVGGSIGGIVAVIVGGIFGVRRVTGAAVIIGIATGGHGQYHGKEQQTCCVFSELFHNMNSPFCRL